jgi:hypothetical protein
LQVAIAFSMQAVCPGVQTAAWQLPPWQYLPLPQSADLRHCAQDPLVRSQSIPSGVQVRSESHFVRQTLATHVFVSSAQSASMRQATQRLVAVLQTAFFGQSSEFVQVVYGTQVRAVQSLSAGQSLAVTHPTHWAIEGSQTMSREQSRLLRQDVDIGPPSCPLAFPPPPHPGAQAASATKRTAPTAPI